MDYKIAITGHTRGLGKSLFDHYKNFYDVKGFSKSTGFDINSYESRKKIILESSDCNVFINNAHNSFSQVLLLQELYNEWANKNNLIINIGSNSKDFPYKVDSTIYSVEKIALNSLSKQLGRQGKCKVTCINFGYIVRDSNKSAIGYADCIDYINIIINSLNKSHRLLELLISHE